MVVAEGRGRNVDEASLGLLPQLIMWGDSDRRPWLYPLVIDGESLASHAGGCRRYGSCRGRGVISRAGPGDPLLR